MNSQMFMYLQYRIECINYGLSRTNLILHISTLTVFKSLNQRPIYIILKILKLNTVTSSFEFYFLAYISHPYQNLMK